MRLTIGITGATGAIFGIRLIEILSKTDNVETHLVISEAGALAISYETDWSIEDVRKLATFNYDIKDISSRLCSGSFQKDGMIIAPCTIKTMSAIANSYNENLIIRSADVTLKERQKLLLLVRESPLHLGHLRTMTSLTEMGAIIMPPPMAFYLKPKTIEDIVDHTIGKILDLFNIKHQLFQRWDGHP